MRTEDFIARCKLLSLLRTLPDRDLTSDERLQLISAFRLFVRQIAHRTRTEESKLDLLRLYACLRTAFKYLKVHRSVPTKEQGYFLDAALSFLETERRIVLLQLRYPAATAAERGPACLVECLHAGRSDGGDRGAAHIGRRP